MIIIDELYKFRELKWLVKLAEKNELVENAIQGFLPSIAMSLMITVLPFILKCKIVFYLFRSDDS
jgi:hypothetical protein